MRATAFRASAGAVLLDVIVTPSASRTRFLRTDAWRPELRIAVAATPTKGKANDELVRFLAESLGVTRSSISIVRGATSRSKTLAIAGVPLETVRTRLVEGGA